jgi:TonB family protein
MLLTWGLLKPKVILPAGAEHWNEHRVRAVLSHELAHIRRCDWTIHVVAEVLRALYWFNPLIWTICRRLRIESEYACDDAALTRGIAGPDYADQLLELARDLNATGRVWSALAIARASTIERRFEAMLNSSRNRKPVTTKAIWYIVMLGLAVALPIALLSSSSSAQAVSGVTGTVRDSAGAAVSSATVILSTASGQTEVTATTNSSGRYGFTNIPAGLHVLQVFAPGFGPSRIANVELKAGQQLIQDVGMDIGFVAPAGAESGQATIQGVVTDPSGAVIPGVEVSLIRPGGATRATLTNGTGSFTLVRVPTGPYHVTVSLPGFKTLNIDGVMGGDNDTVTLSPRLVLGTIAEVVTVRGISGSSSEPPPVDTPARCAALPPAPRPTSAEASVPGRIRQGGFVQQAMLLGQSKPVYPTAAKLAGTEGAVIMEIVVGRDGRVLDIKVISGAPVLTAAALDAVRRWCYTPTKLNGQPVEVVATVTVNFELQ